MPSLPSSGHYSSTAAFDGTKHYFKKETLWKCFQFIHNDLSFFFKVAQALTSFLLYKVISCKHSEKNAVHLGRIGINQGPLVVKI